MTLRNGNFDFGSGSGFYFLNPRVSGCGSGFSSILEKTGFFNFCWGNFFSVQWDQFFGHFNNFLGANFFWVGVNCHFSYYHFGK